MRENRTCGSEGGEGLALPDPYPRLGCTSRSLVPGCSPAAAMIGAGFVSLR